MRLGDEDDYPAESELRTSRAEPKEIEVRCVEPMGNAHSRLYSEVGMCGATEPMTQRYHTRNWRLSSGAAINIHSSFPRDWPRMD